MILDDSTIDTWLRCDTYSTEDAVAVLKPDSGLAWYNVASLGEQPSPLLLSMVICADLGFRLGLSVNSMNNNSPECVQPLEMRAKRTSPSSSPKNHSRSPLRRQHKIESFVSPIKRDRNSNHGDESDAKAEPSSSPASSSAHLPPPVSPFRRKLQPSGSRRQQDERGHDGSTSTSTSSSSPLSSSSSLSSASATGAPAATVLRSRHRNDDDTDARLKAKRKRDDVGEEKAGESDRSTKVLVKEEAAASQQSSAGQRRLQDARVGDQEEQELYSRSQQRRQDDGDRNEDDGDQNGLSGEPWDEDSFPYYLVDDPTLSQPTTAATTLRN